MGKVGWRWQRDLDIRRRVHEDACSGRKEVVKRLQHRAHSPVDIEESAEVGAVVSGDGEAGDPAPSVVAAWMSRRESR